MSAKKTKNNFLIQGSILAIAAIFVRLIGVIYRIPLTNIIGDEGISTYANAYNAYSIILIVSSYSLPLAISKNISVRLDNKEYKNADRIFKASLLYAVVVGGLAAILCYVFAPSIAPNASSVLPLRLLAPTIFLSAVLSVFRGYFQGHQTMIPTSKSQIIEQIINAVISVLAAYLLVRSFKAAKDYDNVSIYGAAGGVLGTGAGVVAGLLFMLFVFLLYRKIRIKKIKRDKTTDILSYGMIFRILIITVTPVILGAVLNNCTNYIENKMFFSITSDLGYDETLVIQMHGVYAGKYSIFVSLPTGIATALASSMIPTVSVSFAKNDLTETRKKAGAVDKNVSMIALPCMVGMAVLAGPVMQLIFHDSSKLASNLLLFGSSTIIVYSLSSITTSVLQGIDRLFVPMKHCAISLVLYVLTTYIVLRYFEWSVYGLIVSMFIFGANNTILNFIALKKYLNYKQEKKNTFVVPLVSSVGMGIMVFGIYQLSFLAFHSNLVSVILSILVGIVTYFVLILLLGGLSEQEISDFPKGRKIVSVCKKIGLLS